jgi:hypothetical protein
VKGEAKVVVGVWADSQRAVMFDPCFPDGEQYFDLLIANAAGMKVSKLVNTYRAKHRLKDVHARRLASEQAQRTASASSATAAPAPAELVPAANAALALPPQTPPPPPQAIEQQLEQVLPISYPSDSPGATGELVT